MTRLRELARIVGAEHVELGVELTDAARAAGLRGHADALVRPATAQQVADVLAWCYEHDVPLTPVGGATGYAGGAVPDGGVALELGRLRAVRALDPGGWRMQVEAGLSTAHVHRLAREHGLRFPPDPGAAEQSQIGGNVATNAAGPHAFKHGSTGRWVTGLEVALAPGELVSLGGPLRKDVAGYDLVHLLVGSEGTLGIVTAVWLALRPAPAAELALAALYPSVEAGCAAIAAVLESGVVPACLEYLDGGALAASPPPFLPAAGAFLVIAEAEGEPSAARAERSALREALAPGALAVHAPDDGRELWRWRAGISHGVSARRGGKLSEDIAVPVERLAEAIDGVVEIGARHGLDACSWGHAGDAIVHATVLLDPTEPEQRERAARAAEDLFDLALRLGGTLSGEHGLGRLKRHRLGDQIGPAALARQHAIKLALDPKGLLAPHCKPPRRTGR